MGLVERCPVHRPVLVRTADGGTRAGMVTGWGPGQLEVEFRSADRLWRQMVAVSQVVQ
jgi:putative AlgH/UPF0301 family transcriptional regulator